MSGIFLAGFSQVLKMISRVFPRQESKVLLFCALSKLYLMMINKKEEKGTGAESKIGLPNVTLLRFM